MSRIPLASEHESSQKTMAVSYSPAPFVETTPTLPSIRELLPDHIHGRGDSVLPRPRYHTELSAPLPYQEWPERPGMMSRSGQPSCSPSPPRMPGPREAAPRSILNDPIQLHNPPTSAHQQPARHSPIFSSSTSHYQSPHASPQGRKRTLPPIQDFHRRSDEFRVYPCGYEQQTVLEVRRPMSQSLPAVPCVSTPGSPAASQPRPFQSSNPNQQYGLYQTPYRTELDYPSPHAIKAQNSPVRVTVGDPGEGRHKKRRGNLPKPVTDILRTWFHEHLDHPYPSEEDKQMFMTRTGLTISQISNWFINARRRQLPALRDRARAAESEKNSRQGSPSSLDEEKASPAETPPV